MLVAAATAVAAWIAWQADRRERRRGRERREAAEARIQADAIDLHGRIWHWLQRPWPVDGTAGEKVAFAGELRPRFAGVMSLAKKMYEDAPHASEETAERVQGAYTKLSVTVNDLIEVAGIESGSGFDLNDHESSLLDRFELYRQYVEDARDLLSRQSGDLHEYL